MQRQLDNMSYGSDFIKILRNNLNPQPENDFHFITCAVTLDDFSLNCFDEQHRRVIAGGHLSIVKPRHESDTQVQNLVAIAQKTTNTFMSKSLNLKIRENHA